MKRHGVAPLVLALLLAGWSWGLARRMAGPVIFHDELGAVTLARHLRLGTPMAHVGVPFYPAHGALLAAFVPDIEDPIAAHRAARGLDAALLAFTALGAFAMARRALPSDASSWVVGSVALGACLHAPLVLYGHLAMSESLLVAAVVGVGVLVVRACEDPSVMRLSVAGAAAGLLPLIHVRGLPVTAAALLTVLDRLRVDGAFGGLEDDRGARRRGIVAISAGVLALVLGLAISWAGARYVERISPPWIARFARAHSVAQLTDAAAPGRRLRIPVIVAGHGLYLGASTLGLVWVGLAGSWWLARGTSTGGARQARSGRRAVGLFAGASLLGTWALSAVFLSRNPTRLDHFLYGRYDEAALAVVLVVALAVLADLPSASARQAWRWGLAAGVSTLLLGAIGMLAPRLSALDRPINPLDVMGLYPWIGSDKFPSLGRLVAIGTVASGLGVGLGRTWPARARMGWIGFSLATALWTSDRYLVQGSRDRRTELRLVAVLAQLDAAGATPACVGIDESKGSQWHGNAYQFYRPRTRFRLFQSETRGSPCSDWAISAKPAFAATYPGARVVAHEYQDIERLWVLPGESQERLAAGGFLEPDPWRRLDPGAVHSRLRWTDPPPARVESAGPPRFATLEVEHAGSSSPWRSREDLGQTSLSIRVGVRWYRADGGGRPLTETRADLPFAVLPGGRAEVPISLLPTEPPLPSGRYHLVVGLLQEGVRWFRDTGDPVLETDITLE